MVSRVFIYGCVGCLLCKVYIEVEISLVFYLFSFVLVRGYVCLEERIILLMV